MDSIRNSKFKIQNSEFKNTFYKYIPLLLCGFFLVLVIGNAWMGDDIFITLRTIDNFVHGFGLRWNLLERVQTFTHPLWLFLLTIPYYFTRETYFTTLAVSILSSLVSFVLLLSYLKDIKAKIVTFIILIISHAYIDYSTSGLENPLTHLLLIVLLILYTKPNPKKTQGNTFWITFVGSLLMLNRLDLGLFVLPIVIHAFIKRISVKNFMASLLGLLPILLWEAFSLIYYGFLFPNTFYAKLHTGIALTDSINQGLIYMADALQHHLIVTIVIFFGVVICIFKRDMKSLMMSLSIGLYVLYIIIIGGDFMTGRFLTAPLIASIINIYYCIKDISVLEEKQNQLITPALLLLGMAVFFMRMTEPLIPPNSPSVENMNFLPSGITNERAFFFKDNGLINVASAHQKPPYHFWALQGQAILAKSQEKNETTVVVRDVIGMYGYFAGPKVYIIDPLALSDPFLAQRPVPDIHDWKIGHFRRQIPEEYIASRETQSNLLTDPADHELLDKLNLITQGPLFSEARFKAILGVE